MSDIPDRIDRIRQRAHSIWEREGKNEGDHERHWQQASDEIDGEDAGSPSTTSGTGGASGLATSLQPRGTLPSTGR